MMHSNLISLYMVETKYLAAGIGSAMPMAVASERRSGVLSSKSLAWRFGFVSPAGGVGSRAVPLRVLPLPGNLLSSDD